MEEECHPTRQQRYGRKKVQPFATKTEKGSNITQDVPRNHRKVPS